MNGRGKMVYGILALAILLEIVSLTALKETHGFTRLVPAALFAAALGLSFYFESIVLKTLPISFTYAAWAGVGIVGMAIVGAAFYGEKVNGGVVAGMVLIIAGVATMQIWAPSDEEEADAVPQGAAPVKVAAPFR